MSIKSRLEKLESIINTKPYIVYFPTFRSDNSIFKRINGGEAIWMSEEDALAEMAGYENEDDYCYVDVQFVTKKEVDEAK